MSFQNAHIVGRDQNSDEYHVREVPRGNREFPMSPSQMKDFAHCPERWLAGYKSKPSNSTEYGLLLDAMVITPDTFLQRYAIQPETYPAPAGHAKVKKGEIEAGDPLPWNNNATLCSEWVEARQGEGKTVAGHALHEGAGAALARLRSNDTIAAWLESSDRQVWVAGEWHDKATGIVVPVCCLIDFVPRVDTEFYKSLGDLKSCRSAARVAFQRQIYKFGWHLQAMFDTDLYVAATGEDRCNWCFVVSENYSPWQPAKRILGERFRMLGRETYKRILATYCRCLADNHWPDYEGAGDSVQGWGIADAEPWMEREELFPPNSFGDIDADADDAMAEEAVGVTP